MFGSASIHDVDVEHLAENELKTDIKKSKRRSADVMIVVLHPAV